MAARTVQQVLEDGLRDIGVGAAGEPIDPEDLMLALSRFNDIVDDFKAQRGSIYKTVRELVAVAANTASYEIGSGATWNVQRPIAIARAGFVNTAVNPTDPLETPIHVYTDEEWAAIGLKTLTSTIVWGIWYETSYKGTAPLGAAKIYVYPICTVAAYIALYIPEYIDEVAEDENGLATTLYVPPGYRTAFRTSVAVDLCDAFEMEVPKSINDKWKRAMKRVSRSNSKPMTLRLPKALTRRMKGGGYNVLTNQ